jgi:hypothetical protein
MLPGALKLNQTKSNQIKPAAGWKVTKKAGGILAGLSGQTAKGKLTRAKSIPSEVLGFGSKKG